MDVDRARPLAPQASNSASTYSSHLPGPQPHRNLTDLQPTSYPVTQLPLYALMAQRYKLTHTPTPTKNPVPQIFHNIQTKTNPPSKISNPLVVAPAPLPRDEFLASDPYPSDDDALMHDGCSEFSHSSCHNDHMSDSSLESICFTSLTRRTKSSTRCTCDIV